MDGSEQRAGSPTLYIVPQRAPRDASIRPGVTPASRNEISLTQADSGTIIPRTMLDWHVQGYRNGQPQDRPATFQSADEAIEAGNGLLGTSSSDEIVVYHRLYSNQACLKFPKVVPEEEVAQRAAQLEKQAQRAAKHG